MPQGACPIDGKPIKPTEILCKTHWFSVPQPLRDEVWRQYRSAPGSTEHRVAVRQALEAARAAA